MLERLYVVRTADKAAHARPGFDERDVQLTELGHAQALDLEMWAHTTQIDAIFCSPMFRALQTVDGAAGVLEVPIRLEESLGPWYLSVEPNTGLHPVHSTVDVLRRSFFRISNADSVGPSASRLGETYKEMCERVMSGLEAIIRHCNQNGKIKSALLIGHAAPVIIISSQLGKKAALEDEAFETAGMRAFKRIKGDDKELLEGWQFEGKTKYLKSAFDHKNQWSFGDVDLVQKEGVKERDGGTDVAALAFALMHQHSPLYKGHARRPSIAKRVTE